MVAAKTEILVYAHWEGMDAPMQMGTLLAQQARGKTAFGFSYHPDWIRSHEQRLIDPDIQWFGGPQYPNTKENFGVFFDSMPDSWGRNLMQRRASLRAGKQALPVRTLNDVDYLLGVYDETRMGALRFKLESDGPFLDNDPIFPTPPWAYIRELQMSAAMLEENPDDDAVKEWLQMLIGPGTSLGGARPKANILDEAGQLWIAKFPAKDDTINKGAWEWVAWQLAVNAGIEMAPSRTDIIAGRNHTFFTRRFDRNFQQRIHFASAMTMTGYNELALRDETASYLDIAEFIRFNGVLVEKNLHQLWRRMVFNIAISNTDDHLRNHGFLLTKDGWVLSPAYDLNPSTGKAGLTLNIDAHSNALDVDLAVSAGAWFSLDAKQMKIILQEVADAVSGWERIAKQTGITRSEMDRMRPAFRLPVV